MSNGVFDPSNNKYPPEGFGKIKPYDFVEAGFSYKELADMADEIRTNIFKGQSGTIDEYIKIAQDYPIKKLNYRFLSAIKEEPRLYCFFPAKVHKILIEKVDQLNLKNLPFSKEDMEYLEQNS